MFGIWFGVCVCVACLAKLLVMFIFLLFYVMDKQYFRNLQLIEHMENWNFMQTYAVFLYTHVSRPIFSR